MLDLDINDLPATEDDLLFDDIEERYQVSYEDGFDTFVVVDNVPVVDQSKIDKLKNALRKIFKSAGAEFKLENLNLPQHEVNGKLMAKGFAFIDFEDVDRAAAAVKDLNNYPMDKTHILKVNRFTDVEKFTSIEDDYVEPQVEPFQEKEHMRSWLADRFARDQFLMYGGDDVSVCWNRKTEDPDPVVQRQHWTATYASWSTQGTYLTTIYKQGVALWGGQSWKKTVALPHPHVELIDFSPSEKYLVTWSNRPIVAQETPNSPFGIEDEGHEIVIWDVRSGRLLRSFPYVPGGASAESGAKRRILWPIFKWSPSDRYFARLTPGTQISIYEAPGMGLLDKKSMKIEGVMDFEWQPSDENEDKKGDKVQKEFLAYWTPEIGDQPARVTVISIPDRTVVRTKNLYNVSDCKLHWQSNGDYLCVKVDRHTKTKKSTFTSFEIFRMREKDIPVEVMELKENALAFAWEPKGDRFAIISTADNLPAPGAAGPQTQRSNVSFYHIEKAKAGSAATTSIKHLQTFEKKSTSRIVWSPRGRHVVLATIGSSAVFDIEFLDVDFEPDKEDRIGVLATREHYGITDIEWDPTGRFLATSSSIWRHAIENGFAIWDFKGELLYKKLVDKFKQLVWRPRPKSLLSKEEMKTIRKTLKQYTAEFDAEDARAVNAVSAQVIAHKKRLLEEWNMWRQRVEKELDEERRALGLPEAGADESNEGDEVIEEWIEEVVEEYEEEC